MKTSNFTRTELKYVAETILPPPDDLSVWRTRENYEGESFAYSAYYGVFDPDEKDAQFRALVEWCVSKYIHTEPHAGGEMAFMSCLYEFGDMKWNVFANTLVDCMTLAVLAHRGELND